MTQCQLLLAWAALEITDSSRSEALLAEAVTSARAQSNELALADALRVRALVELKRSARQEAERALEQALTMTRAMPHPYGETKTLFVYGQLHVANGETERAREKYEAAMAICARLGEGLYRPHIEQALARLGGPPSGN